MERSPRIEQILRILLEHGDRMSVQELSNEMKLSKRTVQRELEIMPSSLKGTQVTFVSKKGSGIWLEGTEEAKAVLLKQLESSDAYDSTNRNVRRKKITLELLKEKELRKLYYYSNKFQVSESTISNDLEEIDKWLSNYNLHIIRTPGSGTKIIGSEENYRKALRSFIEDNVDTRFFFEMYADSTPSEDSIRLAGFDQILDDRILKKVLDCVSQVSGEGINELTESSYVGLVLHLTIAVYRILNNEVLSSDEGWQDEIEKDKEYEIALHLGEILEREFEIKVPKVEISYIYLHLKAAKHEKIQWNSSKFSEIEKRGFPKMISEMIEAFDHEISYWLKQDDEFIQGLMAHLQPTIIRILYNMHIDNPLLDSVKKEYPMIFDQCINVSKVMKKWLGKDIPESEIGFLAVHFGAAMVRLEMSRENLRQVEMGVVCSSGIGISRLMSSKLKREFKDRANINVYGNKDITTSVILNTDFFVSNIPLNVQDVPVVYVNPLLNESDMLDIRKLVYKFERTTEKGKTGSLAINQIQKMQTIAQQINVILRNVDCIHTNVDISFEELIELIGKRFSSDSQKEKILKEDLWNREQITSQIYPEYGFGLLHARTKGVDTPCFCVCLTKGSTAFSNPYMKDVPIIFVMLIPCDDNERINCEILGYISTLLLDEPILIRTARLGDVTKIQDKLYLFLKDYLKDCL